MGDTAVDIFLETLKNLITCSNMDFIIDEKHQHQLQSLAEEIKHLRGFLKITEKKRNEHSEVMNLVMRIREVVSEAENIVELFVVVVFKANHTSDSLREHQDHLSLDLESVEKKIKILRGKVKQILDENLHDINGLAGKKLKHSSTGSEGIGGSSSSGENKSKVVEEKVVVGFKDEVETLMRKLHDSGEGGLLEIISIIGVGGGGKTTLAREVYDHPLTSEKFEIRAWLNVSQHYNTAMTRDFFISILEVASPKKHENYGESSEDKLGEKVYKCLQGRKYLIVMDDIWGIEAWNDIQRSFPKECKGSKVLLTSRFPVQPDSVPCIPHCLQLLSKSCSWELLQKKVFGKKQCPPDQLVGIGAQIAEKCGGLPLAIVAIGGILATEDKTLDVWEKVAKHLSSIIVKNQKGCMEILELSYNHLPLHLKACFLYIGAHPEDYIISVRELIWLWIAEGFIQQSEGGKSLEAVAENYLMSLIDRNLVMVARRSKSHGGIKACRIHDLLREFCLKKAEDDNFFMQIYRDDSISPSATDKHPRLFIGSQFFHKFSSRLCAQNLRSFLCLPLSKHSYYSIEDLSFFVENFKLLRVLHLISAIRIGNRKLLRLISATSLEEIGIRHLVHLRYLALTLPLAKLFRAPDFSNLEILNLQVHDEISLPRNIVKMVKLRHLYSNRGKFEYHHVSYEEEEGIMLDNLQTLHRMCICEHCLRFLKRTPNLRKLGLIGNIRNLKGDYVLNLDFLKCLETLKVFGWVRCDIQRGGEALG
ncbi:putative late blight resistance protein homolog R1A-10 [Rhododendron vialii]|uniref:putative late blight resistance protein homolog R1A-10 n=1 Tax=Rhododendron vialii TaxID=182163 RepID=UPI00265E72BC|nr:putative late blight resistance protein homolog R1A-10 [Rhododendron vialii]